MSCIIRSKILTDLKVKFLSSSDVIKQQLSVFSDADFKTSDTFSHFFRVFSL